tara:strand:- start:174 stop:512 length:339 start_codon:yes stop_codon:yes gene_type:complete
MGTVDNQVFNMLENPRAKNWEFMQEGQFQNWIQESYNKDPKGEAVTLIKSWLDTNYLPKSRNVKEQEGYLAPPTGILRGGSQGNIGWETAYQENFEEINNYLKDYYYGKYIK